LKEIDRKRYQPQIQLKGVGESGQIKLQQARLLCIGIGGLGNPLLLSLVSAGIGHFTLVDGDIVQLSNLQRQVLFTEADLGQYKVDVAKKRLVALNKEVEIKTWTRFVTEDDIDQILNGEDGLKAYDLIIDGTDDLLVRYLLNRKSIERKIPYVFCGVEGWHGQFACFQPWVSGGCFECLFPKQVNQDGEIFQQACQQRGMIGSVTALMAAYQANVVIQCLLGIFKKNSVLFQVNALDFQIYQWDVSHRDGCICERIEAFSKLEVVEQKLEVVEQVKDSSNLKKSIYQIDADQWQLLCENPNLKLADFIGDANQEYLIDMRDDLFEVEDDREILMMPSQINVLKISFAELTTWILNRRLREHLAMEATYLIVCTHGKRAEVISRYLLEAGFKWVCLLA
jgi:molybdopterin/thiamine biosynthesis adenylyltransferase